MTAGRPSRPVTYVGIAGVAEWFGVTPELVTKWIARGAADGNPTPEPDAEIIPGRHGPDKGWLPGRRADWLAWHAGRPGRGAKGRPKPRGKAD